jgi:hypothetical protein
MRLPKYRLFFLPLLVSLCSVAHSSLASAASSSPPTPTGGSSSGGGMILRIRLEDGSVEKVHIDSNELNHELRLSQILSRFARSPESSILVDNTVVDQDSLESQPLTSLGVKHGSMITVRASPTTTTSTSTTTSTATTTTGTSARFAVPKETAFQPFPELAKNPQAAIRARARQRNGGTSTYAHLANVQSSLHVVEPQTQGGRLQRIYMCATSAERFHSSCLAASHNDDDGPNTNRVGLLLGTVQRERLQTKPFKTRTSLSSTPSAQDYCQVAKVHAVWEPPQQSDTKGKMSYDATSLLKRDDTVKRALRVATYLGLQPVGWIFTYSESRHEANTKNINDDGGLPVWAQDVTTGSLLQIEEMKERPLDGAQFVTLAMAATTGATEAFQLSDVSVQMVSEGVLPLHATGRHIPTQRAIIVDGRESHTLDTVLCLVNTALLSHQGLYAGASVKKSTKKNDTLTTKTKKALLKAMDDESVLLELLSDFHVLLALDTVLLPEEIQNVCQVVQRRVRGQKQGARLSEALKRKLQSILQS